MDHLSEIENQTTKQVSTFSQERLSNYRNKINGALQSKNVRIHDRRTSVRLEPEMWTALHEIAVMEGCSIHDLCGAVSDLKSPEASFTATLRVFVMEYYRALVKANYKILEVQKAIKNKQ